MAEARANVAYRRDGYDGYLENTIRGPYDGALIQTGFSGSKRLPNVAEIKGDYAYFKNYNGTGDRVPNVLQQIRDYHNNYAVLMGWSCSSDAGSNLNARSFYTQEPAQVQGMLQSGGLGYRFELTSAAFPHHVYSAASIFNVTTTWANVAVGRALTNFQPKYYLVNTTTGVTAWSGVVTTTDVRDWKSGTPVTLNTSFTGANWTTPPAGEYRLMVASVDPATGTPAIDLALPNRDSSRRYPIGALYVY